MPEPPKELAGLSSKERYMIESFRNQFYPKNEYEHATWMLDSVMTSEDNITSMKHSEIVDAHIQTSFIGNDELMTALQNDLPFLHSGLSMAQRNEGLVMPFKIMLNSWRGGVLLSKAKDGMENQSQHATGAKHQVVPFGAGGYGAGLPQYQPEQQQKSIGDRIKGLLGGGKK
jgi:hypothetical protein